MDRRIRAEYDLGIIVSHLVGKKGYSIHRIQALWNGTKLRLLTSVVVIDIIKEEEEIYFTLYDKSTYNEETDDYMIAERCLYSEGKIPGVLQTIKKFENECWSR